MPGLPLQTEAFVLLKRPPADSFQTFTLFSAEHGTLLALQRLPKKSAANHLALDLFDELAVSLESSNQGSSWFIKEARLLARPANIGRSYETLRHASALAALIARNPVHEDSRTAVATLLRTAFAAFASSSRPDAVFFKSLYCFARDEGYPVKEQWLPTLPRELRDEADHVLYTPLSALEKPAAASSDELAKRADQKNQKLEILLRRLHEYLRGHTEILMD
jgi:hypothetical protein